MKRLVFLLLVCAGVAESQVQTVDWFRRSARDTVYLQNVRLGARVAFLTFPDGTVMATAGSGAGTGDTIHYLVTYTYANAHYLRVGDVGVLPSQLHDSLQSVRGEIFPIVQDSLTTKLNRGEASTLLAKKVAWDDTTSVVATRVWANGRFLLTGDIGVLPAELHDTVQVVRGEIFPKVQDSLNVKLNRGEATALLATKANTSHTQAISTVTALQDTLDVKLNRGEATTLLSGKANTNHTQAISTVIGAQDSLDVKLNRGEATTLLATKANTSHNQAISTITGAQDSLTAKMNRTELRNGAFFDTTKYHGSESINQVGPVLKMSTTDSASTRAYARSLAFTGSLDSVLMVSTAQFNQRVDTNRAGSGMSSKNQIASAYAVLAHIHAQSTVTGLTDSIAAKPTRPELTTLLSGKAASAHSHTQAQIVTTGWITDTATNKLNRGEATTLLAMKWSKSDTASTLLSKTVAAETYQTKGSSADSTLFSTLYRLNQRTDTSRASTCMSSKNQIQISIHDSLQARSVPITFTATHLVKAGASDSLTNGMVTVDAVTDTASSRAYARSVGGGGTGTGTFKGIHATNKANLPDSATIAAGVWASVAQSGTTITLSIDSSQFTRVGINPVSTGNYVAGFKASDSLGVFRLKDTTGISWSRNKDTLTAAIAAVLKADSATYPGYATLTALAGKSAVGHNHTQSSVAYLSDSLSAKLNRTDTTSLIANQWRLNARIPYSDTTSNLTMRWVFVRDSMYRAAQENAIRSVQAADSTYKTAQIATKWSKSDTTSILATQNMVKDSLSDIRTSMNSIGSFTYDTTNHNAIFAADTTYRSAHYSATTAVLKNADSTTVKAGLLKNADSTTIKAGLLKNADSTTVKTGILAILAADTTYRAAQIGTKQNAITNLADTSKYVEGLDSLKSAGYVTPTMWRADTVYKTAQIATKQATISNLADTSKYVEGLDSLKAAGYATRTMLQADTAYRAAQLATKWSISDSTSTLATRNALLDSAAHIRTSMNSIGGSTSVTSVAGSGVSLMKTASTIKRLYGTNWMSVTDKTDSISVGVDTTKFTTITLVTPTANRPLLWQNSTGDSITVAPAALGSAAYTDSTYNVAQRGLKVNIADTTTNAPGQYVTRTAGQLLNGETQWTTLKVATDATIAGGSGWNALADFNFTGTASKTYEIEFCIWVQSATVTVGVNIDFNIAGAGTLSGIAQSTATATTWTNKVIATLTDSIASVHAGVVNLYYPQTFRGIWVNDGSNRAFALQWRKEQVTGTMNQTVGQGSWLRYRIIK
jgi:hypothetical protein